MDIKIYILRVYTVVKLKVEVLFEMSSLYPPKYVGKQTIKFMRILFGYEDGDEQSLRDIIEEGAFSPSSLMDADSDSRIPEISPVVALARKGYYDLLYCTLDETVRRLLEKGDYNGIFEVAGSLEVLKEEGDRHINTLMHMAKKRGNELLSNELNSAYK